MAELSVSQLQALQAQQMVEGLTPDQLHSLVRAVYQGTSWIQAQADLLAAFPNLDPNMVAMWGPQVAIMAAANPPIYDDLAAFQTPATQAPGFDPGAGDS